MPIPINIPIQAVLYPFCEKIGYLNQTLVDLSLMSRLLIKGGLIVTPTEERFTDLLIEGSTISRVGPCQSQSEDVQEVDAGGCYVTPGLFDLQVNGTPECDFWAELRLDDVLALSNKMVGAGVTSILPTLITGAMERLCKNRDFLKKEIGFSCESASKKGQQLVRMPGLHFEGPCLSPKKPGVHPPEHLQPLELSVLKTLVDDSCRLVSLAPELDPSGACIKFLREASVLCSLGHSDANYEEAKKAFAAGVQLMTHTFNALPPLHHRAPGAVGAALLDRSISCCVIPDGMHLVPPMVDMVYRLKGTAKTILVSDIASVGTSTGSLVGSSLLLSDGVRNMVNWGICNFTDAIKMASYNPAAALKLEDKIGHLKAGAYADVLLWDRKTLAIKQVIFNGQVLGQKSRGEAVKA